MEKNSTLWKIKNVKTTQQYNFAISKKWQIYSQQLFQAHSILRTFF